MNTSLISFGLAMLFFQAMWLVVTALRRRRRRADEQLVAHLSEIRKDLEAQYHRINERLLSNEERWKDTNHLLLSVMQKTSDVEPLSRHVQPSRFLSAHGILEQDLEAEQGLVFVLTPFHPDFGNIYSVIRETCGEMGLKCARGDEDYVVGDLLPHLLRALVTAQIVIAVIDGRNPNVFYELGIAHALDKPTILVARSPEETPFDIRAKRMVLFRSEKITDMLKFRHALKDELTKTLMFATS